MLGYISNLFPIVLSWINGRQRCLLTSAPAVYPKCQRLTFDALIPNQLTDDSLPYFPGDQIHCSAHSLQGGHVMLLTKCTSLEKSQAWLRPLKWSFNPLGSLGEATCESSSFPLLPGPAHNVPRQGDGLEPGECSHG